MELLLKNSIKFLVFFWYFQMRLFVVLGMLNLTLKQRLKRFSFIRLTKQQKLMAPWKWSMISLLSNLRILSSLTNSFSQHVSHIGFEKIAFSFHYSNIYLILFRPQQFTSECCHIAGWGKTEAKQDIRELPSRLQVSSIPTKSASVCKREYPTVDLSMFIHK